MDLSDCQTVFLASYKDHPQSRSTSVRQWRRKLRLRLPSSSLADPTLDSKSSLGTKNGVKDRESNKQAVNAFRNQVSALKALGAATIFDSFAKQVVEA